MGNQPSSGDGSTSGGGSRSTGRFLRTTGALGLSKAELDERCRPSGLYPSCNWEDKAIRKLIGDGKLAARLRGTENRTTPTDRECPICFLQYREVNTTKCCSAHICTECYLQVRPQKAKSPSPCPFCNHTKFSVTVAQTMNAEAMLAREETEQRFIEAKIRERAEAAAAEKRGVTNNNNNDNAAACNGTNNQTTTTASTFGSSLQNDERIATLRARSSSLSDHDGGGVGGCSNVDEIPEDVLRESFAMTPEERRLLENEMRAQHSHPLSLRLEAEAQERRLRNEQEFLRQNPHAAHAAHHAAQQRFALEQIQHSRAAAAARSSSSRHYHNQHYRGGGGGHHHSRGGGGGGGGERRNWNQIVEAFERGGHGEVNSLDDLVVLEAAMILSMEEESRRAAAAGGNNTNAATTGGGGGTGTDELFDANRHANEGFPLVRSILGGGAGGGSEQQNEQLQLLANSLNSRRRSRNSFMRAAYGGGGGGADNAAGLLSMGGMSEDDQLAMAIAASLQDQQQQQDEAQEGQRGEGEAQPNNIAEQQQQQQQQQQNQEEEQQNDDDTTTNNVTPTTNATATSDTTTTTTTTTAAARRPPPPPPPPPPPNNEEQDVEEEDGTAEEGDVTRSQLGPIGEETPTSASASGSFSASPETSYGAVVDCDDIIPTAAAQASENTATPEDAASNANSSSPQGQRADALDGTNHGEEDDLN